MTITINLGTAGEPSRAIRYPVGDTRQTILPVAATRAGKYLAFDAEGDVVTSTGTGADAGLRTDLADDTGAALIGTAAGGTVQDALDAVRGQATSAFAFMSEMQIADVEGFTGAENVTAALNTAFAAVATAGGGYLLMPPGVYSINDTVTIPPNVGLDMRGARIVYSGPTDRPAVVIGTPGVGNQGASGGQMQFLGLDIRHKIDPLASELTDFNFAGLRTWNLRVCAMLHLAYVMGFTRGVEFVSDMDLGSSYNTVQLGRLINNREHMVARTAGAANGFVTEFLIQGGSWINSAAYPSTLGSTGFLSTWDKVSSLRLLDNFVFVKPCFELGERGGAGDRVPMIFDGAGVRTSVINARWEKCDGPFMIADGTDAVDPAVLLKVFNHRVSLLTDSGQYHERPALRQINGAVGCRTLDNATVDTVWGGNLVPEPVHECLKSAGGANQMFLTDEWFYFSNSSPAPTKLFTSANVAFKPGYVEIADGSNEAIGLAVDTRLHKSFIVKIGYIQPFRGRLLVRMFNRFGEQLVSASDGRDLLLGQWNFSAQARATVFPYSIGFGGAVWRDLNANFSENATTLRVADEVDYIIIAVSSNAAASGPVRFSNIEVLCIPGGTRAGNDCPAFWPLFDSAHQSYASASPAAAASYGRARAGEVAFNVAPASAAPMGWQCTTSGWNAPAWAISTAYEVDDVRVNGSRVYICTVAGTSAGSGGPTGTGAAIVDGTVTWRYLAELMTWIPMANNP